MVISLRRGEADVAITCYEREEMREAGDFVVVEEPLEISIDGNPYYMTMRLPGEEIQLALGYCYAEGIIDSMDDLLLVRYCEEEGGNRVEITLDKARAERRGFGIKPRALPAYSSCGICGKEMVADINRRLSRREDTFSMPASRIDDLIAEVEARQVIFGETGGTQAVAFFSRECELMALSEDVGRHNALDKAMGKLLVEGRIGEAAVVVATSRLSYEMVQKTGRSSAEILVGVSVATSLAIHLASSINLTLIGFARKGRGSIYTGLHRLMVR